MNLAETDGGHMLLGTVIYTLMILCQLLLEQMLNFRLLNCCTVNGCCYSKHKRAYSGPEDLSNINSVANWMWASKSPKDANLLHTAVKCLVKNVNYLGFSINGGKDSLSMSVDNITETIKSPNDCLNAPLEIFSKLKEFDLRKYW